MTRWLAGLVAVSMALLPMAGPANAVPGPRTEQWWFGAWAIQAKVWPISKGGGVTVAVIDTGVNANLPDLRSAVLSGKDFQIADGNSTGGGDGRTDTDATDGGHGTRMAALIASQGNSSGFVGVAPEAKILPIVSVLNTFSDSIRYAVDHGARVINFSQAYPSYTGPECPPDLQAAISYAIQRDVVVVAGAGNTGGRGNEPQVPATCAGVLAVGAIDSEKRAWEQTQRQSYVAAAAPGYYVGSLSKDGRFDENRVGTSQASALTSGVAALIRSKYPKMSAREVVQRIINTAKDAGPPGKDNMTGNGAVIPAAALTADVPKNAPNPVFEKYDQWAAAHPDAVKPAASQPANAGDATDEKESRLVTIVIGFAVVVVVVAFVIMMITRSRKQRGGGGVPPVYPSPQGGNAGPPPGWGGQSDPPPGADDPRVTPPPR